jgi:hypothetical protein
VSRALGIAHHVQNSPLPAVIPKNGRDAESSLPAASVTPGCVVVRTTSAKNMDLRDRGEVGDAWLCFFVVVI